MSSLAAGMVTPAAPAGWVSDVHYGRWLNFILGLCLVMTFTPDALDYSTLDRVGTMTGESYGFIARVQWFPLFGIGALLCAMRWRLAWALVGKMNPFLILAVVWIFASTLWSFDPGISLRRAIKILGMGLVVFGFFLFNWSPMGAIRVWRNTCALLIVASIVFVVVQPQYAIHQGFAEPGLKGAWRGITTHKNALGILCAMGTMTWVHAWATRDLPLRYCLPVLMAIVVCLIGCKSTTGMVTSLLSAGVVVYLLRMPPFTRSAGFLLSIVALLAALLCLLFVFTGVPTVSEALAAATGGVGKDAGLTGRDLIWGAVLDEVTKHPWLGTGYNAFWISQDLSSPSADVIRTIKFAPLQAHNGYLEILNELGIIGLCLLFGFLTYQFWQLNRLYRVDRSVATLGIAYMVYDLMLNISESNFLRPTFAPSLVEWVVVIMTARALLHYQWLAASQGTARER